MKYKEDSVECEESGHEQEQDDRHEVLARPQERPVPEGLVLAGEQMFLALLGARDEAEVALDAWTLPQGLGIDQRLYRLHLLSVQSLGPEWKVHTAKGTGAHIKLDPGETVLADAVIVGAEQVFCGADSQTDFALH